MKQFSVLNLHKTIGDKPLFRGISFTVGERERIGLIGINGTGKSTLLKILAKIEEMDEGEIVMPKDYRIGILPQDPVLNGELTLLEQVLRADHPANRIVAEYERALIALNEQPEDSERQRIFFEKQKRMDELGGWDISAKAKAMLTKLGLTEVNGKIANLSGGQKKRVALAEALLNRPDLLLLDEPTNHLDGDMIEWLAEELRDYEKSILFVTHDRYFLDGVATKIVELDGGKLYSYNGNYESYLEAKAKREEEDARQREKTENLYRRELAWIKRGAKARTTKQKARIQRFEKISEAMNDRERTGELDIQYSGTRLGRSVIEMDGCWKSFGNQSILREFQLLVKPKDRIGITGKNGSGKTTLLNILSGKEPLDSGNLSVGQTVKIAYYTQHAVDMDENKRVIDYIRESKEVIMAEKGPITAARMLERFLFPANTHGTRIRKLSGGERKRLYLLKLLMEEPNVLLLDEPTNDFDTETLTVLEQFLNEFPGVVITVSHDRYFLDKVCDQILVFQGNGQIETYFGRYSDYLKEQRVKGQGSNGERLEKKKLEKREKPKERKMSYKEKREWEQLDELIAEAEKQLEYVRKEMDKAGSNYEKIHQLYEEEEKWNKELERLIERWADLSELAEH